MSNAGGLLVIPMETTPLMHIAKLNVGETDKEKIVAYIDARWQAHLKRREQCELLIDIGEFKIGRDAIVQIVRENYKPPRYYVYFFGQTMVMSFKPIKYHKLPNCNII
jgi:hypothetical protein